MAPTRKRAPSALTLEQAFGKVVRKLRIARGLSQEKLAFACDRHPTFISLIERGQRSPTLRTVFLLAAALEVKPSRLVAEAEKSVGQIPTADIR